MCSSAFHGGWLVASVLANNSWELILESGGCAPVGQVGIANPAS